jgi:hypothetical protein
MSHIDTMLAWALWWIQARGRLIFPVQINGKRPVILRGFKGATADPQCAANWFSGPYAGCNIGSPTGLLGGSDVLDVDRRPGGDGFGALARLRDAGLLAGAFMWVDTPGDGVHLHFAPTAQPSGRLPVHFLDYKAAGGCILLPPSRVNGRPYVIRDERPPTGVTFGWEAAKRLLCPPRSALARTGGHRGPRPRLVGRMDHLPDWLAEQAEGNRNASLFWAACRAAEARDQDVLAKLIATAVQAGLDEAEAQRTVASAVRAVQGGR